MAYADTDLTIEQIENLIVTDIEDFRIRQHIVVPNVSWGFLNHEADLLICSKDGYLTEIEIKRSWQDFKKDFKKDHTHDDEKLTYFYYAVPEKIAMAVMQHLYIVESKTNSFRQTYTKITGYTENNPHHCGLIVYGKRNNKYYSEWNYAEIKHHAERMSGYKCEAKDKFQLMRLGLMRVWNCKKKIAELQAELQGNILKF